MVQDTLDLDSSSEKCIFFNSCSLVNPEARTCNDQQEARYYCGKYRELISQIKGI